ncbi:hypothetical protein ACUNV4_00380 [Granulosicoccus sp. 3-233]
MLQIVCLLVLLPFLLDACRRSALDKAALEDVLLWVGLTTLVFGILLLSSDMPEGISLKYSGAAFLALTVGYSRALLSMTLLLLITQSWADMGLILLIDALLPIWLMLVIVNLTRRFLPANPFVFLLGCGFFGLFIVYAVQQCAAVFLPALLAGELALDQLFSEQTGLRLLLAGGEATLEGMIITILVVYCPRAVMLFDDEFYLSRPM